MLAADGPVKRRTQLPKGEGRQRKGPAEAAVDTECSATAGKAKKSYFRHSSVLDSVGDRGRSSNYDFGTSGLSQ